MNGAVIPLNDAIVSATHPDHHVGAAGDCKSPSPAPVAAAATIEMSPTPPKVQKLSESTTSSSSSSSKRWRPAKPFINSPLGELRQLGDVKFGPGAKSALLGILGGVLPKLSSEQQDTVIKAKKYAMEQSIKMVLMKQTLAHQQQQLASQRTQVQRQQALALMCRVYVGSISFELKEDTIRAAFLPFGPIKSINMSWDPITQKHKGFAFVEYEIPEGAQLALEQMNGAMMGGRNIKVVGRPSNMPQAQQVIDEIQEEAKNFNRIFIASIHPDLTEEDIKSVFEAFGPILFCRLSAGNALHSHKGYGFIEYATKQAMDEAIASMNLFDLGGQLLRVGRAITPPNALMGPALNSAMPTAAAVAAAAATAKIQAMEVVASHASSIGLENLVRTRTNFDQEPAGGGGAGGLVASPKGFGSPASNSHDAQLSPATLLQPPHLVTPVLGSAGHITMSSDQHHLSANNANSQSHSSPNSGASAAASPNSLLPNPTSVDAHLRTKQEELQKKLMEDVEPQTLQQQETMSIKGQNARHLVMQRLMRPSESKVVIMRNMVGPEDVDEMLKEEIQDECSKFGVVERVIIYNEKQTDNEDDDNADIIVKIFVEFSLACETETARDALNGRYFGGRLVKAELYDQALFDHGDLSG